MLRVIVFLLIYIFLRFDSEAQVPTFYKDIAPIIYNQCAVCHRAGEIGPISLTNYEETKTWAETIKHVTAIKYMPPWQPDPNYSRLQGENYLTDNQINLIAEWVDNGKLEGDINDEPDFPIFPEGSQIGTPDLVLNFEQSHLHEGNNKDEYRYFVIPTGLTEDKIVKTVELRPGNSKIVHHALFFEDVTGAAAENDALTPEYGFEGFGGFTTGDEFEILDQKQFPGYVPGQKPLFYPDGLGQVLSANSDFIIQMHYAPWPIDEVDSSSVNIFFADEHESVDRIVESHIMVPLPDVIINGLFFLLPGDIKTFHGVWQIDEALSFIGLSPHMHLLGKDWTVYIEYPDGNTENMIHIPEWDFNWQGNYYFKKFITAPAGSKIHALATYDNTIENPNNPSNPPQFVSWGENTTDEMYYLPLLYVPYQDGDENIVFDGVSSLKELQINIPQNKLYPIYPNPVDRLVSAGFSLAQGMPLNISIYNINGQKIRDIRRNEFFGLGNHIVNFKTQDLNPGVYVLKVTGIEFASSQKIVKN